MTTIIPHNHPVETDPYYTIHSCWVGRNLDASSRIGDDLRVVNYATDQQRVLYAADGWTFDIANEFLDYVENKVGLL